MALHLSRLWHARRGAVFVEKLIVYLPLLLAFFAAWELAELGAAHVVTQRACAAAGRAAMVVLGDDPSFYGDEPVGSFDGERRADIELAAGMILSSIPRMSDDFAVELGDSPQNLGDVFEVSVVTSYDCGPVSLVCGEDSSVELTATSQHTYHGARYPYSTPALAGGASALTSNFRASNKPGNNGNNNNGGAPCAPNCDPKRKLNPDNKPGPSAKCRSVWRYDRRTPGEVFSTGFAAHGTSQDLGAHVEGSRMNESGFIATTKDKRTAFKLLWQAERPGRPMGCVYEIRECGCGMDVQKTLKGCENRPGIKEKVDQYAYQKEVAIPGRVDASDIVQVICPTAEMRPKPYNLPQNPSASDIKKYADWPPLSSIKTKGPTTKNAGYAKDDTARKNRPCAF
jgi:hypothetical protein